MAMLRGVYITRRGVLFFAGVIILAGLLFGAIYMIRDRAEQARRAEAVKIAEQNLEEQSQTAVETTPAADENTNPINNVAVSDDDGAASSESATVPELPATGTEAQTILVVSVLALGGAYYASSRRAVRDL